MRPFPCLLLAVFIALPLLAYAESCPLTLPQDALTVRAPPGWRGYSPSLTRLTGFGMMGGDPPSMRYLVPTASRKSAVTWRFARGEEKWLYCTYGGSSVIQISKRMQDAASECTIISRETKRDGITEMSARCR
jgi:hypothetical protein